MKQLFNEHSNIMETIRQDENLVVFSSLSEFYHPVKSTGFSIKYVVDGSESYTLNGQKFEVNTGQYLLSNMTNEGQVEIESTKNVNGICMSISPEILTEVVASFQRPDTAISDLSLGEFFTTNRFLEAQYDAKNTNLGKILRDLALNVQNDFTSKDDFGQAFFYQLSEQIITDQIPIFKQLQSIPSIKSSTKKDLFKRVHVGKEYIENYFFLPLTIKKIAKESCMSEYHFFRLFESVFGISPNQFIIQKRLEHGQNILKQDRYSVSTAAEQSGFSDIFAFSKAFKKHFGYSPSGQNRR